MSKVLGVLGGGQLARMLALAAHPLAVEVRALDPAADACAFAVCKGTQAPFDDHQAIARFAGGLDALTFDFENVSTHVLEQFNQGVIRPNLRALATTQDRLTEKQCVRALGLGTADYAAVQSREQLETLRMGWGLAPILKTRRFGYDGKGQWALADAAATDRAWLELASRDAIVERRVAFTRELSVIGVRGVDGEFRSYAPFHNLHREGMLRLSVGPVQAPVAEADAIAARVMQGLDYVGVMAIELFEVGGRLVVNELAPRVHNSGHGSIEGHQCSQFENHVRATLGLPLGDTSARSYSAMVNLIGEVPPVSPILKCRGAHLHLYGKASRAGRKLGHITLTDDDRGRLLERVQSLAGLPGVLLDDAMFAELVAHP